MERRATRDDSEAPWIVACKEGDRAAFEPIAAHIVLLAGPGVCSSDYASFPFKRLRRPIYPLEPELEWDSQWLHGGPV